MAANNGGAGISSRTHCRDGASEIEIEANMIARRDQSLRTYVITCIIALLVFPSTAFNQTQDPLLRP